MREQCSQIHTLDIVNVLIIIAHKSKFFQYYTVTPIAIAIMLWFE
jgi:hypothetical protein